MKLSKYWKGAESHHIYSRAQRIFTERIHDSIPVIYLPEYLSSNLGNKKSEKSFDTNSQKTEDKITRAK